MRVMTWDPGELVELLPPAQAGARSTASFAHAPFPPAEAVRWQGSVRTDPGERISRHLSRPVASGRKSGNGFTASKGVEARLRPVPSKEATAEAPQFALVSAAQAAPPFYPAGQEPPQEGRWSADGWLLLREGDHAPMDTGSAPATYGASQIGAVLRYSLAPGDAQRPAAYVRATAALNGSGEKEIALGLSARPVAGFPVMAAVESRVSHAAGENSIRPAAFAVTEIPPVNLPGGMRGELYAQAGYVGGTYSTAFADGQLSVDRSVAGEGKPVRLRAGGGAWGGAQKGASRLDIGPTAIVIADLGNNASLRLGAGWRFRIAGDAAPDSGPAISLSAGLY